jgi:anti-sigma factor RsiW
VSEEKIIPGGISCREVVELVTDYLEGALDPEVEARFAKHLELCPPCVEYVGQIRTTSRLAAAAEFEERPDADALLAAFRSFWASS